MERKELLRIFVELRLIPKISKETWDNLNENIFDRLLRMATEKADEKGIEMADVAEKFINKIEISATADQRNLIRKLVYQKKMEPLKRSDWDSLTKLRASKIIGSVLNKEKTNA